MYKKKFALHKHNHKYIILFVGKKYTKIVSNDPSHAQITERDSVHFHNNLSYKKLSLWIFYSKFMHKL